MPLDLLETLVMAETGLGAAAGSENIFRHFG
jgi:hypothetical protein